MTGRKIALLAYLFTPLAVLAVLVWAIAYSIKERPVNLADYPPIGAGAGSTGGANAIGELLSGNAANKAAGPNPHVDAPKPAATGLVPPESLEQGFILIVEDRASLARPDSPIYLAGNFNGWNPGDASYKLQPQSDMRWRIEIKKPAVDKMEFKFARGSWELEELDADLKPIANRTLAPIDVSKLAPGEQPKIELVVPRWGDQRPEFQERARASGYQPVKATGTIRKLQVMGGAAGAVGKARDLLVWLPPGYDDAANATKKYPVLYLHDGQNLFEKHAGAPGEWGVDETAHDLISKGMMRPTIIVGIPHAGSTRISEYLPVNAIQGVTAQGDRHVQWLLEEVKPRVERSFRVLEGPENTGIGGSSLGGAISVLAVSKHPDVFGILLAESLPLRTGRAEAWEGLLDSVKVWPRRVFVGMGGKEYGSGPDGTTRNTSLLTAIKSFDSRMEKAGLGPDRRVLVIDPAAEHNEMAWAKRLPQALSFLYPVEVDGTK